jgi:hypothetical protein
MFDLNFYNQIFNCIKFSSQNTFAGLSSVILSSRTVTIRQRPDILNAFDTNKAAYEKYKLNGLLDYVNDYVDYFK